MIERSNFDEVHDVQKAYRKILDSFSRPGKVQNLKDEVNKLNEEHGSLILIALCLVDRETSFMVFNDENLRGKIKEVTYGKEKEKDMDFLFIKEEENGNFNDFMEIVSEGTLIAPHKSTTIVVEVKSLEEGKETYFEGPGIKEKVLVKCSSDLKKIIEKRDSLECEFPTGVDFIFIDEKNKQIAIPRLIKVVK